MEASVWIDGSRLGRYYYPADGGDSTLTLQTPPIEAKFVTSMINLQKIYKDKLK